MKKVIITTLLMTVIATLFVGGGVCFAEESQTNYYYVAKGSELTVLDNNSIEARVVMQVPSTYAFECVEKVDGFVKIKYNGYEGYVSNAEFNQYCKATTSKWGESPYFNTISLTMSNINGDNLTLYNKNNNTMESTSALPKSMYTIDKVYGYYHNGSDYYFLVDATLDLIDTKVPRKGYYIKASETTLADFSKDAITDSAGYLAEIATTPDDTPNGDGSTTIDPSDKDGNTTLPATNNFERYVLIAVIAVLCVVIVILIFIPNKSRRKS